MNKTVVNNFIEQSKELKYFQIIMLVILWVPVVTKASTVHCSDQTTQIIFSGTLLASSTMGLTLFDLFGEIVTEADLKFFLRFGSILFKGSLDPSHFIFEINIGKSRVRVQRTESIELGPT